MNAIIRKAQNFNNWTVFYILVSITVLSLAFSARSHLEAGNVNWWSWADGAFQNFSTEMMGAIATFALFELVVSARKEREAKEESIAKEKRNLIIQMANIDNATALNAVAQLRANGWLYDGSLKGTYLNSANLSGAYLEGVNLVGANLGFANLEGADLQKANLSGAYLNSANLSGVYLRKVNLSGADLLNANFEGANWYRAILPDGTKWTEETDTTRFTDKTHEDFWTPPESE